MIRINENKLKQTVRQAKAEAALRQRTPWWKPKPGWNHVRVYAFESVTGDGEFYRAIWNHQGPGEKPVICGRSPAGDGSIKQPCDRCDEADRVAEESGGKAAARYRARKRYALLVCPLKTGGDDEDSHRVVLFQASMTLGEHIIDVINEADEVEDRSEYFGSEGLTIKFKYDPSATGAAQYPGASALPKRKSIRLDADLQNKAQEMDLYTLPELDPAWAVEARVTDAKDADDAAEAPVEEKPKKTKKAPARKAPEPDPEPRPETTAEYWEAKLRTDGLEDEYDVVMHTDGRPIFYKQGSEDGGWDYPKPSEAEAPEEPPAREAEQKSEGKRTFTPSEEGPAPLDEKEDANG